MHMDEPFIASMTAEEQQAYFDAMANPKLQAFYVALALALVSIAIAFG